MTTYANIQSGIVANRRLIRFLVPAPPAARASRKPPRSSTLTVLCHFALRTTTTNQSSFSVTLMAANMLYFQPDMPLVDRQAAPASAAGRFLPLAYDPFLVYNFPMNKRSVQEELLACQSLVDSVAAILALPGFSEGERQLLRQAAETAQRRQRAASARLAATTASETIEPVAQKQLRDNMLEVQVATLLQGHDLQSWEETDDGGYQARCSYCGQSVYVSHKTLYSLLPEACLGRRATQAMEDGL